MTSGSRGTVWHRNEHDFDLINSKNLFLCCYFPISFFLVGIVGSTVVNVIPRYILLFFFFFKMLLLNQIMLLMLRN